MYSKLVVAIVSILAFSASLAQTSLPLSKPRFVGADVVPDKSQKVGGLPIQEFIDRYVASTRTLDVPPGHTDARIGRGYDSATNQVLDQCVVFRGTDAELTTVLPTSNTNSDAQQVDFAMTHTTDGEELLNTLSINASASFGWGAFSGNASVAYATSKKISRFGEYLLIDEKVENVTQFLISTALTPAAIKVRNNPFKFRQMCGDQFIVGIVTGGSFAAVLNASSSSEDDQTSVAATFSAAAYGNSLDVQTVSKFKDLVTHGRLDIKILRQGPNDNVPSDLDSIKQYAAEMPGKVKPHGGTPYPILMTTKEYGSLSPTFSGAQGIFLDAAGAQYMRLNRLITGLEYVYSHQDLFGGFDLTKYNLEHDAAEQSARSLYAIANACSMDDKKCPATTLSRPRELPGRLQWVNVDPAKDGWTEIGRTQGGQQSVVEARGQFSFYGTGTQWVPGTVGAFLIHNSTNGKDEQVAASKIYSVPDYSVVSYRIFDSYYGDNRSNPGDPLKAAVYVPLYTIP
jgi:hypothetical protein